MYLWFLILLWYTTYVHSIEICVHGTIQYQTTDLIDFYPSCECDFKWTGMLCDVESDGVTETNCPYFTRKLTKEETRKLCPMYFHFEIMTFSNDHSEHSQPPYYVVCDEGTEDEYGLPFASAKVKPKHLRLFEDVVYPGKPSHFIHSENEFHFKHSLFIFVADDPNALITKFEYTTEQHTGNISICLFENGHEQELQQYLNDIGLHLNLYFCTTFGNAVESRMVFKMLATYNEIPELYFNILRQLSQRGQLSGKLFHY